MADKKKVKQPSIKTMENWMRKGGCRCSGPCKCWVEPDGRCGNGYESWLLKLNYI